MAPVKKFQIRTNYAAWVSGATKNIMKVRYKAQEAATESVMSEDWDNYKKLRN